MINIDLTKEQGVNIEFTSNIVYGGEGGKTVDVVQSTGSSKNAVMSQDAVTRELEKKTDKSDVYTKTEVDDKLKKVDVDLSDYATKDYVDTTVAESSALANKNFATKQELDNKADKKDIPDVDNLETKSDANAKLEEAKSYTDDKFKSIDIPELPDLAEVATSGSYKDLKDTPTIPDVSDYVKRDEVEISFAEFAGLVEQGLNTKQDKTAIVTATDAVIAGNRSVIDVTSDVVISLMPYEEDGYAHAYEIVLNVGDTAYSVAFPESVKWVKDLEIEANTTYSIVIEDNLALYVAIK